MELSEINKDNIHNAGVGGSSPPITTISHKALSHFTLIKIMYWYAFGTRLKMQILIYIITN